MAVDHIFVDGTNGDDVNGGTSWADALKTIQLGIQTLNSAGAFTSSHLHIREGIYLVGNYTTDLGNNIPNLHIVGEGRVILDGQKTLVNFLARSTLTSNGYKMFVENIHFKNFNGAAIAEYYEANGTRLTFLNCIFANWDKVFRFAFNAEIYLGACRTLFKRCTFFYVMSVKSTNWWAANFENCIKIGEEGTEAYAIAGTVMLGNAGTDATWRGSGGIDTAVNPPPFEDDSTADAIDLTLDPAGANYSNYLAAGVLGCRIGALDRGAIQFGTWHDGTDFEFVNGQFDDADGPWHPTQAWINDELYYITGSGPGAEGPADAAPIAFDTDGSIMIDLTTVPTGMSARALSPVIEFGGQAFTLGRIHFSKTVSGASQIDDTDVGTVRQIEYRGNTASTFAQNAATGSTDVAWTTVEHGEDPAISLKYVQFRARPTLAAAT